MAPPVKCAAPAAALIVLHQRLAFVADVATLAKLIEVVCEQQTKSLCVAGYPARGRPHVDQPSLDEQPRHLPAD